MSVQLTKINMREGESLIVNFNGSAEHAAIIVFPVGGQPSIETPINGKATSVTITKEGIKLF